MRDENNDWRLQLQHKLGYLYAEWPPSVYYTQTKLRRILRHFFHPHTDNLVNLIHRRTPKHETPDLRKNLEDIRNNCDVSHRYAKEPCHFRVAIPNSNCVFNRSVALIS